MYAMHLCMRCLLPLHVLSAVITQQPSGDSPVMNALLPLFLAIPILLMVLSEIEPFEKMKSLTQPDDDGNIPRIGRVILHVYDMATEKIDRMIGGTDNEERVAQRNERLGVLARALARAKSIRRVTIRSTRSARESIRRVTIRSTGSAREAASQAEARATEALARAGEVRVESDSSLST